MLRRQVGNQAGQRREAIEQKLNQPVVSDEPQIPAGELLRPPPLHVLGRGQQFLLTDFENLADALQQRDIRVGQSPLPFAHRRIGDKQLIGKFLLGHPQLLAPLEDIGAKGLFTFHMGSPLFADVPCKTVCIIRAAGEKVKKTRQNLHSTVGQVGIFGQKQGRRTVRRPCWSYFMNLSMAVQRSSSACSSPSSTASTMQWRM